MLPVVVVTVPEIFRDHRDGLPEGGVNSGKRRMRYKKCISCSRTIGWVGLVTSIVLTLMKAFVGMVAGSQAMVADAMYSVKDVVSSLLVIVGMAVSEKDLDRNHPYGHGKVEFVLAMFVSIIFMAITVCLLVHAVSTLIEGDVHRAPHLIALWAALLAISVNVVMYFYSRCVAIETNSPLVRALAKHHHADAAASLAVAAGIVGAHYLNMPWIDTMVALIETVHLMYLGGDVFWDSAKGLMDRSVESPTRERISTLVKSVEGVDEIKHMRTRNVGQEVFIEIVIGVDPDLSVAEAKAISDAVKETVIHAIARIGSIQVSAEAHSAGAVEMEQVRSRWEQTHLGGRQETGPEYGV